MIAPPTQFRTSCSCNASAAIVAALLSVLLCLWRWQFEPCVPACWQAPHGKCFPAFMFIGVNKAGTSSVARYLSAHPHIRMMRATVDGGRPPAVNTSSGTVETFGSLELDLFDGKRLPYNDSDLPGMLERNLEWTPPSVGRLLGHYTPAYLSALAVLPRLLSLYPNAAAIRFVVLLRRPAARFESDFWMQFRRAHAGVMVSRQAALGRAAAYAQLASTGNSSEAAEQLVLEAMPSLRSDAAGSNQIVVDLLRRGLYAEHLSRWLDALPP